MESRKRYLTYTLLLIIILSVKGPIVSQFGLYSTSSQGGGINLDTDGHFEFGWPMVSGTIGYTTDYGYTLFYYSIWNLFRANNSEFRDSWSASLYSFGENEQFLDADNFTGFGWSADKRYLLVGFQFRTKNNIFVYDLDQDYYGDMIPYALPSVGLVNTFDVGFIDEIDTIVTGSKDGKINAWPSLFIPFPLESNYTHQYLDPLNSSITKLSISPKANYIVYHAKNNDQTSINIITSEFQFIQNLPISGEIDEYKWTVQADQQTYYFSTYRESNYSIHMIQITGTDTTSSVQHSILYSTNLDDYTSGEISFDLSTDGSKFGLLQNYELSIMENAQIHSNNIDELISINNYEYYFSEEQTRITDFAIDETGENVVFNTEIDVYDRSEENYTRVDQAIKIVDIMTAEIVSELSLSYRNVNVDYLTYELYLFGFGGILGPAILVVEGYYWYKRKQSKLEAMGVKSMNHEFKGLYPSDDQSSKE